MRKLIFLFLVLPLQANAQGFNYFYSTNPPANSVTIAAATTLPDGTLFGSERSSSNSFNIFRIDQSGNMLWKRTLTWNSFPIRPPYEIMLMEDSSVVILLTEYWYNEFFLLKCDFGGNVLWAKKYSGIFLPTGELARTVGNDIQVLGNYFNAHINSDGTLKNSWYISTQFRTTDIVYKGNGVHTIMGDNAPTKDLVVFDMDTAGIVSNSYMYQSIGDTFNIGGSIPFNLMITAPSGGVYISSHLENTPLSTHFVMSVDSANHSVWMKKVEGYDTRNIVNASDGGCIVSSYSPYNPIPFTPMFVKFDSLGNVQWIKSFMDSMNPLANFNIQSMETDLNGGWYLISNLNNLHVSRTDSSFSTFCLDHVTQPQVSTTQVSDSGINIFVSPHTFIDSTVIFSVTPATWYRYDACSGQLIDSTTSIMEADLHNVRLYPNPASEFLQIEFPGQIQSGEIFLCDVVGKIIYKSEIIELSAIEIDVIGFSDGIYFIYFSGDNFQLHKQFIVSKH